MILGTLQIQIVPSLASEVSSQHYTNSHATTLTAITWAFLSFGKLSDICLNGEKKSNSHGRIKSK